MKRLPKYLYHATPLTNLQSIKANGLGDMKKAKRLWTIGNDFTKKFRYAVFLAQDPYVAESFVEIADNFEELERKYLRKNPDEGHLPILIFRIKTSDLELNHLLNDENNEDDTSPTFVYNKIIPYDKLEIIDEM